MGGSSSVNEQTVLVCGLEKSGKTLFINKLLNLNKTNSDNIAIEPTFGYNYVFTEYKNQKYHIWDLGGDNTSRKFWATFYRSMDINIVIYMINIYESDENQINSLKIFQNLINEEELKQAKFFLIFNLKSEKKKTIFLENELNEAIGKVEYLMTIIRGFEIHDIDNRLTHFLTDISKIKQGEISTTKLLSNCLLVPEKEIN